MPAEEVRVTTIEQIEELHRIILGVTGSSTAQLYHTVFNTPMTAENAWMLREWLRGLDNGTIHAQRAYCTPDSWHEYGLRQIGFAVITDPRNTDLSFKYFPHAAKSKPGLVAFTPNAEKGRADVQVVIKPGKFLKLVLPDGTDNATISKMVTDWLAMHGEVAVQFTTCGDEVEMVYRHGPRSCMSGHHAAAAATRVYDTPDVAVAYLGTLDKASARCVVDLKNRRYWRYYGDALISELLEAAGYSKNIIALDGCRLKAIPHGESDTALVMPYVDGGATCGTVSRCGRYIILGESGDYECQTQDGHIGEDERPTCYECDEHHNEDCSTYSEHHNRTLCEGCCDSYYTYAFVGRTWRDYVHDDDVIEFDDEHYLNDDEVLSAHNIIRLDNGDLHYIDELVCIEDKWHRLVDDDIIYDVDDDSEHHVINPGEHVLTKDGWFSKSGGLIVFCEDLDDWAMKEDCTQENDVWYSTPDATPSQQMFNERELEVT